MSERRKPSRGALFVGGLGTVLFTIALVHHWGELAGLNGSVGPLAAFVLDGTPALALVYGGYRLGQEDIDANYSWRIAVWTLIGMGVAIGLIGINMGIRVLERRTVSEPVFTLLLSADIGAIAGVIAGYYSAEATTAAEKAEQAANGLSFVNSVIRHDLRNDLQVIDSNADIIAAELDAQNGTVHDRLTTVSEKVDEAVERIEETETIAETMVGTADLEPVDLAAITADLATHIETTYSVTVETDIPEQALVTANAGIRSVVDNLLENAVEHNDADDPHITVAVKTSTDTVTLTVSDNGSGLTDERKETLFEADGTETGGGGLSLVKTIVESCGGTIRVEDNEPQGSTFIVDLHRANSESETAFA